MWKPEHIAFVGAVLGLLGGALVAHAAYKASLDQNVTNETLRAKAEQNLALSQQLTELAVKNQDLSSALVARSDKIASLTAEISELNAGYATGGDSFAYIYPTLPKDGKVLGIIHQHGRFPVRSVTLTVQDLQARNEWIENHVIPGPDGKLDELAQKALFAAPEYLESFSLGDIGIGHAREVNIRVNPAKHRLMWDIHIRGLNFAVFQRIRMINGKNGWRQAYQVLEESAGVPVVHVDKSGILNLPIPKLLFESIQEGFPLSEFIQFGWVQGKPAQNPPI